MLKELWELYGQGYGRVAMAVFVGLLAIVTAIVEGLNIGLLIPLLESFESQDTQDSHWISSAVESCFGMLGLSFGIDTILVALAVLVTLTALLKYIRLAIVAKLRADFTYWIRVRYMDSLVNADLAYFHNAKVGVLTDNITTHSNAAGASILEVVEMVANVVLLATYFIAAFLVSPILTAGAFGVLFLISLSMQYFVNLGKTKATIQISAEQGMQVSALESLSGITLLKTFLLEPLRLLDFKNQAESVADIQYQISRDRGRMIVLQEIALFGLIGTIVYIGVTVLSLNMAVIVALLFILYRLSPKVTSLNTMRHSVAASLVSVHTLHQAIEEPQQIKVINGDRKFSRLESEIRLDSVRYSYDSGSEVLRGTSFTIEAGEMTAIVGPSGAGKSTIINLLLRLSDPTEGRILVDGQDLTALDISSWRSGIGVVSQDIFLFNDTVANNIALGRKSPSLGRILEAAQQAHADEFISMMPNGYETNIGDRGWNLSGGQRQRIALARAIYNQPGILILDEATSSLDSESEQLIQNYVSKIRGSCTLVVVAHRIATIRDAEKIVVLKDGKVAEQGDWSSLVVQAGVFANYQNLQAGV